MNRIKEIRLSRNIKQIELAKELKIAQGTLSTWETGKYEPDNESLKKLADYFNVSVDFLLGRSDIPNAANPVVANKDTLSQKKKDIIEKLMLLSDEDLEILEAAADAIIARRDK